MIQITRLIETRTLGKFLLLFVILSGCKKASTINAERKTVIETVYASGTILAQNEYSVFAIGPGVITQKLIAAGDSVGKGQPLFTVRNDAQSARLEAAKNSYQNFLLNGSDRSPILQELRLAIMTTQTKFTTDSVQYIRYKNLFDNSAISRSQFDDVTNLFIASKNQLQTVKEHYSTSVNDLKVGAGNAKSQVAAAQSDLDNYVIRSDVNGMVFATMKERGEAVRLNEVVALLGDKHDRTIKLSVDQQDIDKVSLGQKVILKTDITGNMIYEAKVVKIYPVMNSSDQTFRVDAEFLNPPPTSFLHNSVEANIIIHRKENALVLPRSAFMQSDSLMIRTSGKVKPVAVKIGITTIESIEVLSGIDEHTDVILPTSK